MAKGITELISDFKILHPLAYDRIYQQGRADQREKDNEFFNFESAWKLEEHDAKVREDAIDEFANEIINPSNYERFDFDDCLYSSDKVNDFFKYVHSIAKQLKENKDESY